MEIQKRQISASMCCCSEKEKISWIERVKNGDVLHIVIEDRSILHAVKRRKSNCSHLAYELPSKTFFFPMTPHGLSDFVIPTPPPPLWLKCNRILSLERPVGAVTLSRWEWWWNERWIWGARGGALNLISTNYPDHGHHGRLPLSRKNAYVRAGNRTRDLTLSSQELWPPSHEAGRLLKRYWRKYRGGA